MVFQQETRPIILHYFYALLWELSGIPTIRSLDRERQGLSGGRGTSCGRLRVSSPKGAVELSRQEGAMRKS